MDWAISQLLSYGVGAWILFLTVAMLAAYALRGPGVFLGHIVIAAIVAGLDHHWIRTEMDRPGWNGQPDQDVVFMLGVLIRVVLVNTALLPLSLWIVRRRRGNPIDA
ncbi:MAG TPA: hypothetical protein VEA69_04395 [Tepidisphaeraceae bacterium]|nr:hypothetical protein [Tepidisphaeraceae bacterium]